MANKTKTRRIENIETIELTDSEPDTTSNLNLITQLEQALSEALKAQRNAETVIRKIRKEHKDTMAQRDAQQTEIERLQEVVRILLGGRYDKNSEIKLEDAVKKEEVLQEEITITEPESLEPSNADQQPDAAELVADETSIPVNFDTKPDIAAHDSPVHYEQNDSDLAVFGEGPGTSDNSAVHEHEDSIRTAQTPDLDEEFKGVAVTIKTEQAPDEPGFISFSKSEDGKYDIWNLDYLNIGPPLEIDRDRWAGFSRRVIEETLGSDRRKHKHHWEGTRATKIPFITFSRYSQPELPRSPGQHGIVFHPFRTFYDHSPVTRPIDFVVGEGKNNWRYIGSYNLRRRGEILTDQWDLLPPTVVHSWAKVIYTNWWGGMWVNNINKEIAKKAKESGEIVNQVTYSMKGLCAALKDGRLTIEFTIMECVRYRADWHEQLLHNQRHPKSIVGTKRKGTGGKGTPAKRVKGRSGKQLARGSETSDSEESDDLEGTVDSDDAEEDDTGPRTKQRFPASITRATRLISLSDSDSDRSDLQY